MSKQCKYCGVETVLTVFAILMTNKIKKDFLHFITSYTIFVFVKFYLSDRAVHVIKFLFLIVEWHKVF